MRLAIGRPIGSANLLLIKALVSSLPVLLTSWEKHGPHSKVSIPCGQTQLSDCPNSFLAKIRLRKWKILLTGGRVLTESLGTFNEPHMRSEARWNGPCRRFSQNQSCAVVTTNAEFA